MQFYRQYSQQIAETLDRLVWANVQRVVDALQQVWLAGGQVFVMGNGGSAATASHIACDFGKNTIVPSLPRLRVMSLNDNMALFSAHANDDGYENVFAEQLANWAHGGDVVLAISASGNSPNVLHGVEFARARSLTTIGWSGYYGGKLSQLVDIAVVVPNHDIQQIEDVHLMLGHMVTTRLRQAMQGRLAPLGVPAAKFHGANLHPNGTLPS
jgi:D-sedoheptulose 7-phosphate isomerase